MDQQIRATRQLICELILYIFQMQSIVNQNTCYK